MSDAKDVTPIEPLLCSKCFRNEGLMIEATWLGIELAGACPNCGAADGRKLDKDRIQRMAFNFFVRGTYHRVTYGGAPVIQFNEAHYGKTDVAFPDVLKADVQLIEEAARIGFFYYSPRMWMLGHVTPLEQLEDPATRQQIIERILREYPVFTASPEHKFYRLRCNPTKPADPDQYDSPPADYLGKHRLDSPALPILYASQDLEVCVHECRVTVEDDIYVATLRPANDLTFLDLTDVLREDATEFESLDIAVHMAFLAGPHSYEISRAIALAANNAGFNGVIYPSYYTAVRTGRMPIETAWGISIRRFPGHEAAAKSHVIPNLAIFGRPIREGAVKVDCINRMVLSRITYDGVLGPVEYGA